MRYIIIVLCCFYAATAFTQTESDLKTERGKASYYSKRFHNRKTASGALYKKDSLVCAHRTYPFGTKLLVKNVNNNKEVVVEVIDRGPFKKGRIIDLSYAAAKKIDMIHHGIIKVEVMEYRDPVPDNIVEDSISSIKPSLSSVQ